MDEDREHHGERDGPEEPGRVRRGQDASAIRSAKAAAHAMPVATARSAGSPPGRGGAVTVLDSCARALPIGTPRPGKHGPRLSTAVASDGVAGGCGGLRGEPQRVGGVAVDVTGRQRVLGAEVDRSVGLQDDVAAVGEREQVDADQIAADRA